MDFLAIARAAAASNDPSPYLSSSDNDNDNAHHVGLWACRANTPVYHVKKSRGYKWVLNHVWQLDFAKSNYNPTVKDLR